VLLSVFSNVVSNALNQQEPFYLLRALLQTSAGATVQCSSKSMEPTIVLHQSVCVFAVPLSALAIGDVVLFARTNATLMMHRVLWISWDGTWFVHAGDAPQGPVARKARTCTILGRVRTPRRRPALRTYGKLGIALARTKA